MRTYGLLVLALSVLSMTKPASSQTYDRRYPVCMHVYGDQVGERIDCVFASLSQCQGSASALSATCLMNPYYAPEAGRRSKPRNVKR